MKLTPYELKELKEELLNIVSAALIQQPRMSVRDPTIRKITRLIKQIAFYDPEFVLKMAMYVRLDLNIRSTANYILAVASNVEECRPFMKKYFAESVRLPSDWLDVAATYSILPDKGLKGKALPTCLRKAMVAKFPDFDAYQLGKYNKERSIKRKLKKMKEDGKAKPQGRRGPVAQEKPMITLKQMIRVLHINQPHLQVMCLLGKKYPMTETEFAVSGLYGKFDPAKAGQRMKLPTPETWETMLSEKGNHSSTWEELLDHNKLPFMAMLRNLRNLIYTGVHPRYHKKVCGKLSNKQTVANSKQFPFQFFSAYEVIPKDLEAFKALLADPDEKKADKKGKDAKGKPDAKDDKAGEKPMRRKNKKVIKPTHMPTDKIFADYRRAIDQAVKHATTCNVSPIRGATVVFCNVSAETRASSPGAKGMGGSVRSVQDIGYLLGLMCKFVCEDCDFRVYSSAHPDRPDVRHLPVQLKEGSILENMAAVAEVAATLGEAAGEFPFDYLEEMIKDKTRVDNFLVLSHQVINPQDDTGKNSRLANLLKKYRMEVNPQLLFVSIDLSGSGKSAIGQDERNPNDIQITGFSDQILRFIAERGDTNQLQYVQHIDEAKLNSGKRRKGQKKEAKQETVQWDVSPWWKFLDSSMLDAVTYPNIAVGAKWRDVRIFISSTFVDMHGERDILTRVVLPEIKERAKQRKIKIYEVDLRWGVTEHESQTGQSIQLCLDEVNRCDMFLGLVGERYGWAPEQYNVGTDHPRFDWLKHYPTGRSITELEMHHAALSRVGDNARKSFFYLRDPAFLREVPEKYRSYFVDSAEDSTEKVKNLAHRVLTSGLPVFDHYPCTFAGLTEDGHPSVAGLDLLGERIFHDLWGALDATYPAEFPSLDPVEIERGYHQAFVQDHAEKFVGRKQCLADLQKFVLGFHNQLMVVHGTAGDGKSALLSYFVQDYAQKNPRTFVLPHFISVSPKSADVRHTLHRLCSELVRVFELDAVQVPEDYKELVALFPDVLEQAAFKGKLVIVIDAVNQLDEFLYRSHLMEWLPAKLPCKFIISTLAGKCLDSLRRRFPGTMVEMTLTGLDVKERTELIRATLWKYHKKLDERPMNNQMRELLKKTDCGNPLYISVACEELRVFGLYEKVSERIKRLSPTTPRLLEEVLKRLETDHGRDLVQRCCTCIVISRGGLLEHELIRILAINGYQWSGLMRSLSLFLKPAGTASLISFFHDSFKEAVRKRYLAAKNSSLKYHAELAEYFLKQIDPEGNMSLKGAGDLHAVSEVAYHLVMGERWSELVNLLTDLRFVEVKALLGLVYGLLDDYNEACRDGLKYNAKAKVLEYRDYVKSNVHVLVANPSLVFQQAANQPSATLPAQDAQQAWTRHQEKRAWLEWINKPQESDSCKMTFAGYTDGVTATAISSDEALVASASQDCVIKIYNLATSSELATLVGHSNLISCLRFSPDNAQLASASWDESVIVWDVANEFVIATLTGHERRVNALEYNRDGTLLATASWDTTVRVWDCLADFTCKYVVQTGERPVNCLAFSADESCILAGLWDGTVKVFKVVNEHSKLDFKEGECVATLTGHTKSVQALAVSSLGKHLATGSMDNELLLWDAGSNKLIANLSRHSRPVTAVAYTKDGSHLLSASADSTVKVWEANLGTELASIPVAQGYMTACAFSPTDATVLVTGSSECHVVIWDLTTMEVAHTLEGHTRAPTCVEFSPDGRYLATASEDSFRVWDCSHNYAPVAFEKDENQRQNVNGLAWRPVPDEVTESMDVEIADSWDAAPKRGQPQAQPARGGKGKVAQPQRGQQQQQQRQQQQRPARQAETLYARTLVTVSDDCNIRVWRIPNTGAMGGMEATKANTIRGHDSAIRSVCFDAKGETFSTAGRDNLLKQWHLASGQEIATMKGHRDWITSCAYSDGVSHASASTDTATTSSSSTTSGGVEGGGARIATCGWDMTVRVWNPRRPEQAKFVLEGHSSAVGCVRFTPNGLHLLSCSYDGQVKVWDALSGTELTSFGHKMAVHGFAISRDGKTVATVSDDCTIKLWDPLKATEVRTLIGHADAIKAASFSAETRRIVTASLDRTMKVWDAGIGKQEDSSSYGSSASFGTQKALPAAPIAKGTLKGHTAMINSIAICKDSQTMLTGSDDKTLRLWDLRQNHCLREMNSSGETIKCCQVLSPQVYLTAADTGAVCTWDARTGRVVDRLGLHKGPATTVSVAPGGTRVISGGWDNTLQSFDTRKPSVVTSHVAHTDWILSASISRRQDCFASGGWGSDVYVWTPQGGNAANAWNGSGFYSSKLVGHLDTVTSVDISHDSSLIASGSYDSTIKLWNVSNKSLAKSFAGHRGRVNSLAFLKDGSDTLISGGDDKIVRLWDVQTGHSRGEFFCQGPVTTVASEVLLGELVMLFGDSIGNLYLSKLHQPRL